MGLDFGHFVVLRRRQPCTGRELERQGRWRGATAIATDKGWKSKKNTTKPST
jgi:hypothetical protein